MGFPGLAKGREKQAATGHPHLTKHQKAKHHVQPSPSIDVSGTPQQDDPNLLPYKGRKGIPVGLKPKPGLATTVPRSCPSCGQCVHDDKDSSYTEDDEYIAGLLSGAKKGYRSIPQPTRNSVLQSEENPYAAACR